MVKRICIVAVCVIVGAFTCIAKFVMVRKPGTDPLAISSVSGTVKHDSTLVISGTAFGTKAQATPICWDDLESGEFSSYWSDTEDLDTNSVVSQRHTNSTYCAYRDMTDYTVTNACVRGSDSILATRWFVSWWWSHGNTFTYGDGAYADSFKSLSNMKIFRLWHPSIGDEYLNIEFNGGNNWVTYQMAGVPLEVGLKEYIYESVAIDSLEPKRGSWHQWQCEFKENTGLSHSNGFFQVYLDCMDKGSRGDIVTRQDFDVLKRPRTIGWKNIAENFESGEWDSVGSTWLVDANWGQFWGNRKSWTVKAISSGDTTTATVTDTARSEYKIIIDSWSNGTPTPANKWFEIRQPSTAPNPCFMDDFYVDTTWARVEVGNNAVYGSCTHREMQVPSAWSGSEITVTFNQGGFATDDTVYVFVVDSESNKSSGYQLIVE